jgi:hypothetical protein
MGEKKGEIRFADFDRKRPLSTEEFIEQTADVAATIGLLAGSADPAIFDQLKDDLAMRMRSLNKLQRFDVEALARRKIDQKNIGEAVVEPVFDSAGREIGLASTVPLSQEEAVLIDVWSDVLNGDLNRLGELGRQLSGVMTQERIDELDSLSRGLALLKQDQEAES